VRLLIPSASPLSEPDLLDLYADRNPGLRAGFVLSVDGASVVGGTSRGLQTPADQAAFFALRAVSDAVLIGAETARREGYRAVGLRADGLAWRRAHGLPERPRLVVVSRSQSLDGVGTPDRIVVTSGVARTSGEVILAGEDEVDLGSAVEALGGQGLRHLLCEGGPGLLGGLLRAGLVDELCLTSSPVLVGAADGLLRASLPAPVGLTMQHLVDGGDGTLLARYGVAGS